MSSWYLTSGPASDVVVSSRVRMARNIAQYPFPWRMTSRQQSELIQKVGSGIGKNGENILKDLMIVEMAQLPFIEKQALVERHVVSPDFVSSRNNSALAINADETLSIMINEEDHLRIQAVFSGMQLDLCMESASSMDHGLAAILEFAYDERLGFLTACPTNLGTGIRASVMMHLPGLAMTGLINPILESCNKLGVAVRGWLGENTKASGDLFQVSNQVTLGLSEEEIVFNVKAITNQIIAQEKHVRAELIRQDRNKLEDKVYRSYGVLQNARILSAEEALSLLSSVKFGVDSGLISGLDTAAVNTLMVLTQPASIQKIAGKPLDASERDIVRAAYIRENLTR